MSWGAAEGCREASCDLHPERCEAIIARRKPWQSPALSACCDQRHVRLTPVDRSGRFERHRSVLRDGASKVELLFAVYRLFYRTSVVAAAGSSSGVGSRPTVKSWAAAADAALRRVFHLYLSTNSRLLSRPTLKWQIARVALVSC